jgi:hypothetical protein
MCSGCCAVFFLLHWHWESRHLENVNRSPSCPIEYLVKILTPMDSAGIWKGDFAIAYPVIWNHVDVWVTRHSLAKDLNASVYSMRRPGSVPHHHENKIGICLTKLIHQCVSFDDLELGIKGFIVFYVSGFTEHVLSIDH